MLCADRDVTVTVTAMTTSSSGFGSLNVTKRDMYQLGIQQQTTGKAECINMKAKYFKEMRIYNDREEVMQKTREKASYAISRELTKRANHVHRSEKALEGGDVVEVIVAVRVRLPCVNG